MELNLRHSRIADVAVNKPSNLLQACLSTKCNEEKQLTATKHKATLSKGETIKISHTYANMVQDIVQSQLNTSFCPNRNCSKSYSILPPPHDTKIRTKTNKRRKTTNYYTYSSQVGNEISGRI